MGFIGRVPLYGGEVVELAAQPGSVLPVLDNTSVYWFAANWVWRVAKNGGQATALIGVSSLVLDFAIDDASVYFVTESGELRRVDKFAGAPSEVLATGLGSGPAVAVDASRLYWIDKDAGELLVADKQGKNPVVLADNIDPAMETVAGQLLLDATFVYWFGIGGWIYRTPK